MKAIAIDYRKKSTNVRKLPFALPRAKDSLPAALGALSQIVPALAARLAEHLYLTPPRFAPSREERDFLATAHRFIVRHEGRQLAAWSWGDGPTILFVHGWGGRGGQCYAMVPSLIAAGFSVVTFDAPGHGESGNGESSLLEFARVLPSVVAAIGGVHAVVAHSMGAAATAVAMEQGLNIPRVVFVASPTSAIEYLDRFAAQTKISARAKALLLARLERRIGRSLEAFRLDESAPTMRAPLLVFNDRDDKEVPLENGKEIAALWPGAELVVTTGLGHHRILRSPEVVERAVDFLRERK